MTKEKSELEITADRIAEVLVKESYKIDTAKEIASEEQKAELEEIYQALEEVINRLENITVDYK